MTLADIAARCDHTWPGCHHPRIIGGQPIAVYDLHRCMLAPAHQRECMCGRCGATTTKGDHHDDR